MKKYILALLTMSILLLTGCQTNNAPIERVNDLLDMVLYNVDSNTSIEELGMPAQEVRSMYLNWLDQSLASFLMLEEIVEDDEQTDEILDELPLDEVLIQPVDPLIRDMSETLINKMHDIVTYQTRIMTLGRDTATVKVSIYAMDMSHFYSGYMEFLLSLDLELEQEEILQNANERFKDFVAGVLPSSTPTEFYVELTRMGDTWQIDDPPAIVYQGYNALTGN